MDIMLRYLAFDSTGVRMRDAFRFAGSEFALQKRSFSNS